MDEEKEIPKISSKIILKRKVQDNLFLFSFFNRHKIM